MKLVSSLVAATLVFAVAMLVPPAAAQESGTPAAVTDPLNNYTLDVLVPVRPEGAVSSKEAVAKEWIAASDSYHKAASNARELVKTRITTKDAEISALEARVKEAKATGDKAEMENLKRQIKAQKDQLDALKGISKYAGQWDELADALDRAGKEWLQFLDAEQAVAQRQANLSRELVKKADSPGAGQPTADDFKLHKKLLDEYKEFGAALKNYGDKVENLGGSAEKVLSAWQKRNLSK